MKNIRALATPLLAVSVACGGVDGMESPVTPQEETDLVRMTLSSVGSTNDCDPAKGNPGDFRAYIEAFTKENFDVMGPYEKEATSQTKQFTLNAEYDDYNSVRVDASTTIRVPRRDRFSFLTRAYVAERDSGSVDEELEGVGAFIFRSDLDCWFSVEKGRCGSASFSVQRRFREDEFRIFNSDDEGCQISMNWSVVFE
ncbi:MAG: hypothetical protein AAF449_09000 [Myxococcota bacterium]